MIPQLSYLLDRWDIESAYVEDVPLFEKKGKLTLVQLGAVQGSLLGLCGAKNINVTFISPSTFLALE